MELLKHLKSYLTFEDLKNVVEAEMLYFAYISIIYHTTPALQQIFLFYFSKSRYMVNQSSSQPDIIFHEEFSSLREVKFYLY
jgi:hypothetical protein